jgi:hypothetical protein
MLSTEQKIEYIMILRMFLQDPSKSDATKALFIRVILGPIKATDVLEIVQTDGFNGDQQSVIRDSISMGLPLVFETLYTSAGACECFHIDERYKYHSYEGIIALMQQQPKFCATDGTGFGPGGALNRSNTFNRLSLTWLQCMQQALCLEDRVMVASFKFG